MSKVCAAKYVASWKTPAQGVVRPARKFTTSASAPITSSLAAKAAKQEVSQKTPAQATPARKSSAIVLAPTISSPAAKDATTTRWQ